MHHAAIVPQEQFKAAMARFVTGVTVVSFNMEGEPAGLTANAFMSVSLDPMLILVSIRRASRFCTHVHIGDRYAISLLSSHQQDACDKYAGRQINRPVPLQEMDGLHVISGSIAHLVARVVDIHAAGDHQLYIGRVESLAATTDGSPLVYFNGRVGSFKEYATDQRRLLQHLWPDMAID